MADEPDLKRMSLEQLADELRFPSESHRHLAARAELTLRQTIAQLEATEAQKAAAKAEEAAAKSSADTAIATRRNANYLLWSVIVAAGSAIASAFSAYFAYLSTVPK
jgi:hypothetical protein